MKCEGAADPPCIRCRKAGRECLPQISRQRTALEFQSNGGSPSLFGPRQLSSAYPTPLILNGHSKTSTASDPPRNGYVRSSLPPPTTNFRFLPDPRSTVNARVSSNDFISGLPSIYSTSPVDAIIEPGVSTATPRALDSVYSKKRKRNAVTTPSDETLTPANSYRNDETISLTRKDMRDMVAL